MLLLYKIYMNFEIFEFFEFVNILQIVILRFFNLIGLDNVYDIMIGGDYVFWIDMEYFFQQYYVKYLDFNIQFEGDNY